MPLTPVAARHDQVAGRGVGARRADERGLVRFFVRPRLWMYMFGAAVITGLLSAGDRIAYGAWWQESEFILMTTAFEAGIYITVMRAVAQGRHRLIPRTAEFAYDYGRVAMRYFVFLVPIKLALLMYDSAPNGEGIHHWSLGGVFFVSDIPALVQSPGQAFFVGAGLVLLPYVSIAIAVSNSLVHTFSPRHALRLLRVLGVEFIVVALMFYGILLFEIVIWVPVCWEWSARIDTPVITSVVLRFLIYVPMFLRAYILGALASRRVL